MKILLLGEYSGIHLNLKEGLQELGHEVLVAGWGDGYRKIPVDISFESNLPLIFGKIHARLKPYFFLKKLQGYDIVQQINTLYFYKNFLKPLFFAKKISRSNKKFFLLSCGEDYFFINALSKMKIKKIDFKEKKKYFLNKKVKNFNIEILKLSDGIIPTAYEYSLCYQNEKKRLNPIPMPINTNKINFSVNKIKSKLIILHGITRGSEKGTPEILKALDYLSKKYPNDIKPVIVQKLSIEKYLKVVKECNVIIDQLIFGSNGMNTLYALAMGKIVMTKFYSRSFKINGAISSPLIFVNSAESIIIEIKKLLERRNTIESLGFKSREYVEKYHNYIEISKQYIKTWKSN